MWQIPLVSAFFYVGNSFALKILVDKLLAKSSQNIVLLAVLALIGIAFLQEVWCRLAHLAFISSQTKIRTAIILKLYHLVQKKDYYFFSQYSKRHYHQQNQKHCRFIRCYF